MTTSPDKALQEDVLDFLSRRETHGCAEGPKRIDTHGAIVFLAGPNAYKVKRAVRLPFLDYSTLDRRKAACEAEIAVNRANAPDIYLGTVPIVRDGPNFRIGGPGEIVEWAVHLKRFDETQTLDLVADRGELDAEAVRALAEAVLLAHQKAKVRKGSKATGALQAVIEETSAALQSDSVLFPAHEASHFTRRLGSAFASVRPLLEARESQGHVRACHGDLHLRNIVLIEGRPVLFDAIEFDEAISVTDVLYDLAFLLMDLWTRGLRDEANHLLNRYLWKVPDLEQMLAGLAAFPLFLALRAAIRAKVEAIRLHETKAPEARSAALNYFEAARVFLKPHQPRLVGIGGLSGTGKSTLAARIAASIGRPPGAVHLRSDIQRKRMFGREELDRLPQDAYREEVSDKLYAVLNQQAAAALAAGASVIVDAMHGDAWRREELEAVSAAAGVPFTGIWLEAPADLRIERVAERIRDASDATPEVARRQIGTQPQGSAWTVIDASRPLDQISQTALAACRTGRQREQDGTAFR